LVLEAVVVRYESHNITVASVEDLYTFTYNIRLSLRRTQSAGRKRVEKKNLGDGSFGSATVLARLALRVVGRDVGLVDKLAACILWQGSRCVPPLRTIRLVDVEEALFAVRLSVNQVDANLARGLVTGRV